MLFLRNHLWNLSSTKEQPNYTTMIIACSNYCWETATYVNITTQGEWQAHALCMKWNVFLVWKMACSSDAKQHEQSTSWQSLMVYDMIKYFYTIHHLTNQLHPFVCLHGNFDWLVTDLLNDRGLRTDRPFNSRYCFKDCTQWHL